MSKIIQVSKLIAVLFCLITSTLCYSQVGIGTTTPKTTLDVNGAIALREGPNLVLVNGNNNNISLGTKAYSFYRIIGPTTNFNLSGIIPVTASDGQILTLENSTNAIMNILHNSNLSNPNNRIFVGGEKDYLIRGRYSTITLQYNILHNRWIILNKYSHFETGYVLVGSAATPPTAPIVMGYSTIPVIVPDVTPGSSAFAGLVGNSLFPSLQILNVECRTGIININVFNPYLGSLNNVQFTVTINKI